MVHEMGREIKNDGRVNLNSGSFPVGIDALAGDADLAFAAAIADPLVRTMGSQLQFIQIGAAGGMVLAENHASFIVDGLSGAGLGAHSAHGAVFKGGGVGSFCGLDAAVGDDAAESAGDALFGDQAFGQGKGA